MMPLVVTWPAFGQPGSASVLHALPAGATGDASAVPGVGLVATLEEQGRMTDAGRAAVEAARADGRWDAAYAGPATRQAPDDLAAAIAAEPDAQAMFDVLTSANRFALIHRVESMKRAESRARKITEMVEMLARGETLYPQKAGHPGRAGQGVDARQ